MNDRIESELRAALQERGDRISPTPALPGILHRARGARTSSWRRWGGVGGAVLATGGLVAAVLVIGPGTSDDRSGNPPVAGGGDASQPAEPTAEPTTDPTAEPSSQPPTGPTGGEPVTVEPGTVVPMALHYVSDYAGGTLVSGEFEVTSSGDLGVDAVQALLDGEPREPFVNYWSWLNGDPNEVPIRPRSVTRADDVITVDFNRSLSQTCGDYDACAGADARMGLQQLVQTVQSALRSDAPVLVTVNGQPADKAFGKPVDGPVAADPSVAPSIRVASPEQGATVSSPVVVTGESNVFEASFVWEAIQDGTIVKDGIAVGGSIEFAPFEFSVKLPPGDYTIAMWAENMSGDAEGLAPRLSPVYLDITVE